MEAKRRSISIDRRWSDLKKSLAIYFKREINLEDVPIKTIISPDEVLDTTFVLDALNVQLAFSQMMVALASLNPSR